MQGQTPGWSAVPVVAIQGSVKNGYVATELRSAWELPVGDTFFFKPGFLSRKPQMIQHQASRY